MSRSYILIYLRTELQSRDSATPRPMIQLVPSCRPVPVAPVGPVLVTGTPVSLGPLHKLLW